MTNHPDTPEVKPVTQSRDTQELLQEVAANMLHIFCTYAGMYEFAIVTRHRKHVALYTRPQRPNVNQYVQLVSSLSGAGFS